MADDQPSRDVYHGVRWSAVARYGAMATEFAVAILLTRLLEPRDFGLVGMALVFTRFFDVFRDGGLGQALVHRDRLTPSLLSTTFYLNLAVGMVLGAAVMLLAPWIGLYYGDFRVESLVLAASPLFLISSPVTVSLALHTRRLDFQHIAAAEICSAVARGVFSIALALAGFGVWALMWGTILSTVVHSAILLWTARWLPERRFSWEDAWCVVRFGSPIMGTSTVNYLERNVDNLLIGRFLGAGALGFYSLAYRLMLLPLVAVSRTVSRVAYPVLCRLQDDDEAFGCAFLKQAQAIAVITFPMMAGMAVVAEPFTLGILGPKWAPVIPLIVILAPVGAIQSLVTLACPALLAKGKTHVPLCWVLLTVGFVLGGFYVGLQWGLIGVVTAYALLAAVFSWGLLYVTFLYVRSLSLWRLLRSLRQPICLTVAMAVTTSMLRYGLAATGCPPLGTLTLCIVSGAVFYAGASLRWPCEGVDILLRTAGPLLAFLRRIAPVRAVGHSSGGDS